MAKGVVINQSPFVFPVQSRERFCQLTQLIRNRMLAGEDQDIISVFVGSWNMGDAQPPQDINSWIVSLGQGKTLPTALSQAHDLYAFGTQVCHTCMYMQGTCNALQAHPGTIHAHGGTCGTSRHLRAHGHHICTFRHMQHIQAPYMHM